MSSYFFFTCMSNELNFPDYDTVLTKIENYFSPIKYTKDIIDWKAPKEYELEM